MSDLPPSLAPRSSALALDGPGPVDSAVVLRLSCAICGTSLSVCLLLRWRRVDSSETVSLSCRKAWQRQWWRQARANV